MAVLTYSFLKRNKKGAGGTSYAVIKIPKRRLKITLHSNQARTPHVLHLR